MGVDGGAAPAAASDKNLVRTDAKEQKLDRFVTATPRAPPQQQQQASLDSVAQVELVKFTQKSLKVFPENRLWTLS